MENLDEIVLLGKQPIIGVDEEIYAYELLYRSDVLQMDEVKNATASVVNNLLNVKGLKKVIGESALAFINVDDAFLSHDMARSMPREFVVYELQENLDLDKVLPYIKDLHNDGYRFAFCIENSNVDAFESLENLCDYVEYIKINILNISREDLYKTLFKVSSRNKKIIATHIESESEYRDLKDSGISYFQGYFFSKPILVKGQTISASDIAIIEMCNLLSTDASTKELVSEFEKMPDLTLRLIRYIGSASISIKEEVKSMSRVITLLGRTQIRAWLFLTLYSINTSKPLSKNHPSVKHLEQRCTLMKELCKASTKVDNQKLEEIHFLALVSLLESIFLVPFDQIFEKLNVDKKIREALLDKKGELGEIFALTLAIENFDMSEIEKYIREHKINISEFQKYLMIGLSD